MDFPTRPEGEVGCTRDAKDWRVKEASIIITDPNVNMGCKLFAMVQVEAFSRNTDYKK